MELLQLLLLPMLLLILLFELLLMLLLLLLLLPPPLLAYAGYACGLRAPLCVRWPCCCCCCCRLAMLCAGDMWWSGIAELNPVMDIEGSE